MNINFGGHDFFLHHSGILFWPEQSLLIVSDLHLEKGSHFALRGFFLPPYDSHETLKKLHAAVSQLSARKILILGDCFHDEKGYARLREKDRYLFDQFTTLEPIWINGNHDGDFVPPGFISYDEYRLEGITFRHEAGSDSELEISGHYHPKVEIIHKGALITRPCFIEDGRKMLLPSYGAYTGGLAVNHPSIATLFTPGVRIYPIGKDKVFAFSTQ